MTTIGDIRDAIGRVFLSINGVQAEITNFADPKTPIDPADIPGFFIHRATRAEHERFSSGGVQTTRTFLVVLLVGIIPPLDPMGKQNAYDLLESYLAAVPLAFSANAWTLTTSDDRPLAGVAGITRFIDDTPEEMQRENVHYTAIPYRISVTTNRAL